MSPGGRQNGTGFGWRGKLDRLSACFSVSEVEELEVSEVINVGERVDVGDESTAVEVAPKVRGSLGV